MEAILKPRQMTQTITISAEMLADDFYLGRAIRLEGGFMFIVGFSGPPQLCEKSPALRARWEPACTV